MYKLANRYRIGTLTRRKGRNAAKGKENEVEETMREHEDVAYEHHQKSSVLVEEEEMDEEEADGGVGPLMESEDSDGKDEEMITSITLQRTHKPTRVSMDGDYG